MLPTSIKFCVRMPLSAISLIGLKSRRRNCSYTSLVQGSSVWVIKGCNFSLGKTADRNASEPICSLVNLKWRCWPSGHRVKAVVDDQRERKRIIRSPGVAGMVCCGRLVVQDGRSVFLRENLGKKMLDSIVNWLTMFNIWTSLSWILNHSNQNIFQDDTRRTPYTDSV